MIKQIKESVKISRLAHTPGALISGLPFAMNMGKNEVILLMALDFSWSGIGAAGENIISVGLWKKTDTDPVTVITDHSDMIWTRVIRVKHVAESIGTSGSEFLVFPAPLVLIRAPRIVGTSAVFTSPQTIMRIHYKILKVTDKDLAELMVKDHA